MTSKEKVKELTDKLESGIENFLDSEEYSNFLTAMSHFRTYSLNNTMLIYLQKPGATLVAGYRLWEKEFNRHVKKGEKAIYILAPIISKSKDDEDDEENSNKVIRYFRSVTVFDISQTEGDPVPSLNINELKFTVDRFDEFKDAIISLSTVPIAFEDIEGNSKGYFNSAEKRIGIKNGMSKGQTIKTMVHELAHSVLHSGDDGKSKYVKETEAESIAYVVCQHLGFDTSEYSFPYLASWSQLSDLREFKASLTTIQSTSMKLINDLEGYLSR